VCVARRALWNLAMKIAQGEVLLNQAQISDAELDDIVSKFVITRRTPSTVYGASTDADAMAGYTSPTRVCPRCGGWGHVEDECASAPNWHTRNNTQEGRRYLQARPPPPTRVVTGASVTI
jgi:hypothetical protein